MSCLNTFRKVGRGTVFPISAPPESKAVTLVTNFTLSEYCTHSEYQVYEYLAVLVVLASMVWLIYTISYTLNVSCFPRSKAYPGKHLPYFGPSSCVVVRDCVLTHTYICKPT